MVVPSTLALRIVDATWLSSTIGMTSAKLANGAERSDRVSSSLGGGRGEVVCDAWEVLDEDGVSSRGEVELARFGCAWQLRIACQEKKRAASPVGER